MPCCLPAAGTSSTPRSPERTSSRRRRRVTIHLGSSRPSRRHTARAAGRFRSSTPSATTRIRSRPASRPRPHTMSTSGRATTHASWVRSTWRSPAPRSRPRRSGTSRTDSRPPSRSRDACSMRVRRASPESSPPRARRRNSRQRCVSPTASLASRRSSTSCSPTSRRSARWQSGLLWANWRRKPAFAAYRAAIAEVRAGTVACASPGAIGRPPLSPSPVPERVWR
jgi:hypothetical protein